MSDMPVAQALILYLPGDRPSRRTTPLSSVSGRIMTPPPIRSSPTLSTSTPAAGTGAPVLSSMTLR